MHKSSAGILAYRYSSGIPEVLLVHPGGPFFARQDDGTWSIPKGELEPEEDRLVAAKREFFEEIGMEINGIFSELKPVKTKGGKIIYAYLVETTGIIKFVKSNLFSLEWPAHSGKILEFPEVDKAEWFSLPFARTRINSAQVPFLDELCQELKL